MRGHEIEAHFSFVKTNILADAPPDPYKAIASYFTSLQNAKKEINNGETCVSVDKHIAGRSQDNPSYPERIEVKDSMCAWSSDWKEYTPDDWTHDAVLKNGPDMPKSGGWADPPIDKMDDSTLKLRVTYARGGNPLPLGHAVEWNKDKNTPLNPAGRTGIEGRGLLGKWGANHAADPIVTRFCPKTGNLQVVAIQRKDTGQWALPGGMVDAGEHVSETVKREFKEEAGAIEDDDERQKFLLLTDKLFASGTKIYRGYVDDPRATDNAWMESTAFHFHCPDEIASKLPLKAGDDAGQVMWMDVSESNELYRNLYGSHKHLIEEAVRRANLRRAVSFIDLNVWKTTILYGTLGFFTATTMFLSFKRGGYGFFAL